MTSPLRVMCSPLTKRIYVGRVANSGDRWSGQKTDVTSDVLAAIVEKIGVGGEAEVTVDGKPTYTIRVADIAPPSQQEPDHGR